MALIDCPECDRGVSSYATVCPGCGFPVARALRESVDEITGSDKSKAFRGKAAGDKLSSWADQYSGHPAEGEGSSGKKGLAEKKIKIAIFVAVLFVVVLQLLWLTSAL